MAGQGVTVGVFTYRHGRVVRHDRPALPKKEIPVAEAKKYERNMLSRSEMFKAAALLREWANEIKEVLPSYKAIADRLATALKFPVSEGNVRGIAKDLDMAWEPRRKNPTDGKVRQNIYRRTRRMEDCIEKLKDAVLNLASQMGAAPPPSLADWPERPAITGGKSPQDKG